MRPSLGGKSLYISVTLKIRFQEIGLLEAHELCVCVIEGVTVWEDMSSEGQSGAGMWDSYI